MGNKKVGLALGSGAARGMAHIGVMAVLEKEGIPVDVIAGTSTGAVVGALYAQGKDTVHIEGLALDLGWKKIAPLLDPSLPRSGLIKGRKIKDLLASFIGGDIKFSALKIPFACVATDITTGEEVVLNRGPVSEAVRASISLPAVFAVVKKEGRYLVDGGLVDPVPVNVAKRMGADFVIAVNVIPDVIERAYRIRKEREEGSQGPEKEPNIFQVLLQSIYIGTYALVARSMEEADVIIEPRVAHIGSGDFHHAQECIRQGELAAQSAVPEIKRKLKNL